MKQIYEIEYLDEEERELIEDIESAPVQPPIPNMAAEIARYRRYAAYQLGHIAAIDLQPWQSHNQPQTTTSITPNPVWQHMTRLPERSLLSSMLLGWRKPDPKLFYNARM